MRCAVRTVGTASRVEFFDCDSEMEAIHRYSVRCNTLFRPQLYDKAGRTVMLYAEAKESKKSEDDDDDLVGIITLCGYRVTTASAVRWVNAGSWYMLSPKKHTAWPSAFAQAFAEREASIKLQREKEERARLEFDEIEQDLRDALDFHGVAAVRAALLSIASK